MEGDMNCSNHSPLPSEIQWRDTLNTEVDGFWRSNYMCAIIASADRCLLPRRCNAKWLDLSLEVRSQGNLEKKYETMQ